MSKFDNSSNENKSSHRLRKDEIIHGHNSYLNVLRNSVSVSTEFLKVFIEKKDNESDFQSPLLDTKIKVGFIIAKKKIKKAVLRNRIKRLLKESYRMNKEFFASLNFNLNLIFSLNEKGYDYFISNPKTKKSFIDDEMISLQKKIQKTF